MHKALKVHMDQKSIVLAALAAGSGAAHSPVQVQKLMFLIDREIPKLVGGPHFDFQPYDYGPFDQNVYRALEQLRTEEALEIVSGPRLRRYRLTEAGQARGKQLLSELNVRARTFISAVSEFVRKQSFEDLVAAIYKAYPDMKVNSVFKG